MNVRSRCRGWLAGVVLWGLLPAAWLPAAAPAAEKPSVIVILADDLGYADLGFQGAKDIPTPHLDRLAREGVRSTSGYVSHPFCSPTRAGLMTGRYQQRFGHENNPRYDPKDEKLGLPLEQVTFAQVMRSAGYATGAVGKWHLGATPRLHPMKRGFDEYFGLIGGGHDYFKAGPPGETREYLIPLQRDGQPVVEEEYLTEALSREAVAFVRRHCQQHFFLYLAYNAPHTPLQVPERYLGRVAGIEDPTRRAYAAMITAVDDGVGQLLAALGELGLERRTLVFFLSDNGGPTSVTHSSNAPLRGQKGSVLEGGIRVPLVVRWTGHLPSGKVYPQPVICLDILPTAAAAGGAPLPGDRTLDGVNLLPYLRGEVQSPPHEFLFWRAGSGQAYAVRHGRYKLVKTGKEPAQLFDLETDIGESKDLAAAEPERAAALAQKYAEWNAGLVPPLWENPRPAAKAPKKQARAKR